MRLDSALKNVVPNISRSKKSRHFLMKLPDNFQMREHSRPCRFHSMSNMCDPNRCFDHSQFDHEIIFLFMFLTVGVVSLTTGKQKQKGQWTYLLFSYNLQIYNQCTKIEYTPNFISDNQFKHCYMTWDSLTRLKVK